jgi:hypothetical protein
MFAEFNFNKTACCHYPVILKTRLCENEAHRSGSQTHDGISRLEIHEAAGGTDTPAKSHLS